MKDNALIIFTRNPELGKCKTRLAKSLGDDAALKIYKHLLQHTANIAKEVEAKRFVFYSEKIQLNDIWDNLYFDKKLQEGSDLGHRMENAFRKLFSKGYKKVLIIGSDLLDLTASIIKEAYLQLNVNDVVMGPAMDGGYYLLGLKTHNSKIFKDKDWGTESVRAQTLEDLNKNSVHLLKELNDIDTFEDMQHYNELKQYYTL